MGTTCDRMGCSAPATVVFGADPRRMMVVMEAVDPTTLGALRPGILCTEHADRLTVPRGWTLDDRREPTPRLFRVPVTPIADHRGRTARPSTMPVAYEQPMLTVVADEIAADEIAADEPVVVEPVVVEPVVVEPVVVEPVVVEPVLALAIEWDERDPVAVPLVDDLVDLDADLDDLDADLDESLHADVGGEGRDVSDGWVARELEYVADPDLDPGLDPGLDPDPSWPVRLDDTGGVERSDPDPLDTARWRGDRDGRPR